MGYPEGLCPSAEDLYRRAVSIPLFPAMSDLDVERVIDVTGEVARRVLAKAVV